MKVIVAHPGKQHSMHTALAVNNKGALFRYITTVYDKPISLTRFISYILRGDSRKKAMGRKNNNIPNDKVLQFCEIEGLVLLAILRIPFLKRKWSKINDWVTRRFELKVAKYAIKNKVDVVIMYDCACDIAFKYLKEHDANIKCVMDCSISNRVYNKKIYEEDILITKDEVIKSEQAYLWKENGLNPFWAEVKFADYYLVPSNFVEKSIIYVGGEKEKIYKIPYGVDLTQFKPKNKSFSAPLKLLYVGGVMRRKGLHHLLKVISEFPSDEVVLQIAGSYDNNYDLYKQYSSCTNIKFLGFVTRDILADVYNDSHVFVLPSLAEGLALVGLEALAAGLPVVCTDNSGVNDIVKDYENGIVFKTGNDDELRDAVIWLIKNIGILEEMGNKARLSVKEYSWNNYYNKIQNTIELIYKQ